jgi:pyocin large subunit-like protein
MGLLEETVRLSLVGMMSVGEMVMTLLPLTLHILIVTGQMISILSLRVPAKTALLVVLMTVGNGQLSTARVAFDGV